MNRFPRSRVFLTSFFLVTSSLAFWGCTEGCDDSKEGGSAQSGSSTSGSGKRVGSGEVDITPAPGKKQPTTHQTRKAAAFPESKAAAPRVVLVDAMSFRPKVLKSRESLVSLVYPGSSDCAVLDPVVETVSADWAGKVDFYRMDGSLPENTEILPEGVSGKIYPSFILYRDGKVVGWKEGLPFQQDGSADETAEAYQGRLTKWLSRSLTRRDFGAVQ